MTERCKKLMSTKEKLQDSCTSSKKTSIIENTLNSVDVSSVLDLINLSDQMFNLFIV